VARVYASVDSLSSRAGSASSARWSIKFAIVNNRFLQAGHPGVTTPFPPARWKAGYPQPCQRYDGESPSTSKNLATLIRTEF